MVQILKKPTASWTVTECNAILIDCMSNTARNPMISDVQVFALPTYPKVLLAYNMRKMRTLHWTQQEFNESVDRQARNCLHMTYEGSRNIFLDESGNTYRGPDQIVSLMILISIENIGGMRPDISNLEDRIYLRNERGEVVYPDEVRGRRNRSLLLRENLQAVFKFNRARVHFLGESREIELVISGFNEEIHLPLTTPD
ncbi:MAG: hypothetical protein ACHQQQ_03615 [Bacteroidota bacterium]